MVRALKLDKGTNKRLKKAVSDVAVRCSYFLYLCLRRKEWCTSKLLGWNQKTKGKENGKFSMQQFLVAKSTIKSPTGCRQGVWQGVNGYLVCVLTAHDPWEAFVSACCWVQVPHTQNTSMGLSQIDFGSHRSFGLRFRFWTVELRVQCNSNL